MSSSNNKIGKNVVIKEGVILGDNVVIEDDVYIDYNCIIRNNVTIKQGTTVGPRCILGEVQSDFYTNREENIHPLIIGKKAIVRSGSIIYGDSHIGDNFQTGHNVTIRENTFIGNNVSLGTFCDIQGNCEIGNYVRIHSNVFVAPKTVIKDFVWLFPHVVITNDPTPPSEDWQGVVLEPFSVIAAGSIILPGVVVESDSLVAAGAVVTKNVQKYDVVAGNPARVIANINNIKNRVTGKCAYPWREYFKRGMPWQDSSYEAYIVGEGAEVQDNDML